MPRISVAKSRPYHNPRCRSPRWAWAPPKVSQPIWSPIVDDSLFKKIIQNMDSFLGSKQAVESKPPTEKYTPLPPVYSGAGYIATGYDPRRNKILIEKVVPKLLQFKEENPFDSIAFTGYSGIAIGTLLAHFLDVAPIAVRKHGSHDTNMVFGNRAAGRYIIVDDLISSGQTLERIILGVERFAPDAKPIAIFLSAEYMAIGNGSMKSRDYHRYLARDIPVYGIKID